MRSHNHYVRQAAVEETVARLNSERTANGLTPDYIVGYSRDGTPSLAIATPTVATERVRLNPAPKLKRERL